MAKHAASDEVYVELATLVDQEVWKNTETTKLNKSTANKNPPRPKSQFQNKNCRGQAQARTWAHGPGPWALIGSYLGPRAFSIDFCHFINSRVFVLVGTSSGYC